MKTFLVEELTSSAYQTRIRDVPGVILPLGSIEVLGSHGPLGADFLVAEKVALLVAERTSCLVAPAIPYGDTLELASWPGTVCIPTEVLGSYYYAVAKSFLEVGRAKSLVFFNFHSLNGAALHQAARELKNEGHHVFSIDWWKTVGQWGVDVIGDQRTGFGHGGEMITSVTMRVCPGCVDKEEAQHEEPKEALDYYGKYLPNSGSPFVAYGNFHDYCVGGAWGDTSKASEKKGAEFIERAVTAISEFLLESFKRIV